MESFASRSKGVEEPNYINVQATSPRPLSIKQDPDEVNGYVPDPTDKVRVGKNHIARCLHM